MNKDGKMKTITLAHGAGGRLSAELLEKIILPALGKRSDEVLTDGALLKPLKRPVFTTDSFVVNPLFFRGGSIGRLAVCGTVNDLAVSGAKPIYLSLSLIIEEGLSTDVLKAILEDVRMAAEEADVQIVTGDTKVVPKGMADGIFINTAGVGELYEGVKLSPLEIKEGMKIILSGTIGEHTATVMAKRHQIDLPKEITSDAAPLNSLVKAIIGASKRVAVMRDATRGGVASVLNELSQASNKGMLLEEESILVKDGVRAFADILGLEILELANEGKLIAIVPAEDAKNVLFAMQSEKYGKDAAIIGEVKGSKAEVALRTQLGTIRLIDMPLGELVPRIC